MSSSDLEERLTAELGGAAYRLPPPPLAEVWRRAARRRLARATRRVTGAAVAVALAVVAVNSATTGESHPSTTPTKGARGANCHASVQPKPTSARAVRMLPDRPPAGTALLWQSSGLLSPGCGATSAYAWAVGPATGRVERLLRLTAIPSDDPPNDDACSWFSAMGEKGECRHADVAGETRSAWWVTEDREAVAWIADGRTWWVSGVGFDAAEFEALVAALRVDDGGTRVRADSLPDGLQVWESAPDDDQERWESQSQFRLVPGAPGASPSNGPGDVRSLPGDVLLEVTEDPTVGPFGNMWLDPLAMTSTVVDVGGRPGIWSEGSAGYGERKGNLTWLDGRASISLWGTDLTQADAIATAETVRRVDADDPRLTCDPATSPWKRCG